MKIIIADDEQRWKGVGQNFGSRRLGNANTSYFRHNATRKRNLKVASENHKIVDYFKPISINNNNTSTNTATDEIPNDVYSDSWELDPIVDELFDEILNIGDVNNNNSSNNSSDGGIIANNSSSIVIDGKANKDNKNIIYSSENI